MTDPVVIGRDPSCSISLDDPNVSRRHCSVVRDSDGGLSIVDNGSTNGTVLNGRQIRRPQILKRGDEVELGKVVLEVRDL